MGFWHKMARTVIYHETPFQFVKQKPKANLSDVSSVFHLSGGLVVVLYGPKCWTETFVCHIVTCNAQFCACDGGNEMPSKMGRRFGGRLMYEGRFARVTRSITCVCANRMGSLWTRR